MMTEDPLEMLVWSLRDKLISSVLQKHNQPPPSDLKKGQLGLRIYVPHNDGPLQEEDSPHNRWRVVPIRIVRVSKKTLTFEVWLQVGDSWGWHQEAFASGAQYLTIKPPQGWQHTPHWTYSRFGCSGYYFGPDIEALGEKLGRLQVRVEVKAVTCPPNTPPTARLE